MCYQPGPFFFLFPSTGINPLYHGLMCRWSNRRLQAHEDDGEARDDKVRGGRRALHVVQFDLELLANRGGSFFAIDHSARGCRLFRLCWGEQTGKRRQHGFEWECKRSRAVIVVSIFHSHVNCGSSKRFWLLVFAYGHTQVNIPYPVRFAKSSICGLGQY